jgi:hypothetical protein
MRSLDAAIGRSRRLERRVLTSIEDKHGRVVGRRNERDECANK